jgi:hypothetical protein
MVNLQLVCSFSFIFLKSHLFFGKYNTWKLLFGCGLNSVDSIVYS